VSEVVTGRRCSREVASCKMSPELSLHSVSYVAVFITRIIQIHKRDDMVNQREGFECFIR